MSDRAFRGGIQKGTTASSTESTKLDNQLKRISLEFSKMFPGFNHGHSRTHRLFEGIETGCVPDGGIWFDNRGAIRAAFEAKHQQNGGNAIERHAKNHMICKAHRGERFQYVTFMTGEGATPNGVLELYAKTVMKCENNPRWQELNTLHHDGASFFLKVDGFTDEEIRNVMEQVLG